MAKLTPTRCAIYTRQSADPRDDLSSCQVQYEACRTFVESQRAEGLRLIKDHFDDEGHSGATLKRPALQRLLEFVRAGKLDRVVVHRLDRLSRNLRDYLVLLKEFRSSLVRLIVVTAPELGRAAHDTLVLNVLASFAEFERELAASRIAEARARLKAHGRRIAGAVPFGYDTDRQTKQLIPNEREAEQVRWMFERAAEGLTATEIARRMNALGWRTKMHQSHRKAHSSGGSPWSARQVLATLSNPVYLGKFADGDRLRDGHHKPIVPEALYRQARSKVEARRTGAPGKEPPAHCWPLSCLVRCAGCGRTMSTHTVRHRNLIYRYYRCRSAAGGRPPCKGGQVSAGDVEEGVRSFFADPKRHPKGPWSVRGRTAVSLTGLARAWRKLSPKQQENLMRNVVREVVYDSVAGKLRISFDRESIWRAFEEYEHLIEIPPRKDRPARSLGDSSGRQI